MLSYLPDLSPQGEVKPIFNPDDFEKQYASVTYADLLDYTNLYSANNFHGSNSFIDIVVSSINNVSAQVLGYVATLRGDAQQQLDSKRSKDDNIFIGDVISVDNNNAQHKLTTEAYVDTSVLNMKNQILGGAGPAYDTLVELQTEIVNNDTQLNALLAQVSTKAPINSPAFTGTVTGITKAMVGLSAVNNTSDLNKPISNATQTALNLKAPINNPSFTGTVSGITKAMVDLANVDNTSDASKPISSATQSALDLKAPLLDPTFPNSITVINNSTFNKGITVNETQNNATLNMQSVGNGVLVVTNSAQGSWNPMVTNSDSSLVYYGAGGSDTGVLNICNWSNGSNGIKLTKQLTKVMNNFEVSNGYFVGSPIFRPTGNCGFGLGNNVYNTTALTSPIIYNGLANGTGNNATYTDFNVSFNSWYGTGFVCTSNNACNAVFDHTNGNFTTKGDFTGNNLSLSNSAIVNGNLTTSGNIASKDITARAVTLTGNLNMSNNTISAKELYLSSYLYMSTNSDLNGIIRATNSNSTLFLGANNQNLMAINSVGMQMTGKIQATDDIIAKDINLYNQVQPLNNSRQVNTTYTSNALNNTGSAGIYSYVFNIPARFTGKVKFTVPVSFRRSFSINEYYTSFYGTDYVKVSGIINRNGYLFKTMGSLIDVYRLFPYYLCVTG